MGEFKLIVKCFIPFYVWFGGVLLCFHPSAVQDSVLFWISYLSGVCYLTDTYINNLSNGE